MAGSVPAPNEGRLWLVVQSIRELYEGRSNAVGTVTLALAPSTTTTVIAPNCGPSSQPILQARNNAAAAAVGNGLVYVSAVNRGSFEITHGTSPNDREFGYVCLG